jgi:hypothetical protein
MEEKNKKEILQLKENWGKEEGKIVKRIDEIKEKSKGSPFYRVDSQIFKELKGYIEILEGRYYEPDDMPWDILSNVKYVCEHCKPRFPVIEILDPHHNWSYFANPPSYSEVSFYLKIIMPKSKILKKIDEFHSQIEKSKIKNIANLLDEWSDRIEEIMQVIKKRRFECKIIKEDISYMSYICSNCEEKGLIKKMEQDTLRSYIKSLDEKGLNKDDYKISLEVKKEVIW